MKQDVTSYLPQPEEESEQTCEGSQFISYFSYNKKNNFHNKSIGEPDRFR